MGCWRMTRASNKQTDIRTMATLAFGFPNERERFTASVGSVLKVMQQAEGVMLRA